MSGMAESGVVLYFIPISTPFSILHLKNVIFELAVIEWVEANFGRLCRISPLA